MPLPNTVIGRNETYQKEITLKVQQSNLTFFLICTYMSTPYGCLSYSKRYLSYLGRYLGNSLFSHDSLITRLKINKELGIRIDKNLTKAFENKILNNDNGEKNRNGSFIYNHEERSI